MWFLLPEMGSLSFTKHFIQFKKLIRGDTKKFMENEFNYLAQTKGQIFLKSMPTSDLEQGHSKYYEKLFTGFRGFFFCTLIN